MLQNQKSHCGASQDAKSVWLPMKDDRKIGRRITHRTRCKTIFLGHTMHVFRISVENKAVISKKKVSYWLNKQGFSLWRPKSIIIFCEVNLISSSYLFSYILTSIDSKLSELLLSKVSKRPRDYMLCISGRNTNPMVWRIWFGVCPTMPTNWHKQYYLEFSTISTRL